MHEGDTVEIIAADDPIWVGRRGVVLSTYGPYFTIGVGEHLAPTHWTAGFLKLVETYEQAATRELGDEYFA